jgi:predicted enzyme related to lactoylglutathione lyase
MNTIKAIAFTGYPVTDVPRARAFYENILGLKPDMLVEPGPGMWWIEYEIGGSTFAISNAWAPSGQSGPCLALEVADIDASLAHLTAAGVPLTFPMMDTPVCRFFGIKDPDGNGLMIHQCKKS